MEGPMERYQKLGLRASFCVSYKYPIACKELSFILRWCYSQLPKPVQSLVFQDAVSAFRLLPEMQIQSAISAAHILFQSVEATLPKQKRAMAVKEFKQAMVAQKRRSKSQQEDEELIELPQDVLVHVFGFLDVQSLVLAGMVCRSWNAAANDNCLWQSRYFTYFEDPHIICMDQFHVNNKSLKAVKRAVSIEGADDTVSSCKDAFRRKYIASPLRKLKHDRAYCTICNALVWLTNLKCPNTHDESESKNQLIKSVMSPHQIVTYLLSGAPGIIAFSDDESDSDEETDFKLWAYPWN